MNAKMQTAQGRQTYHRRMHIGETWPFSLGLPSSHVIIEYYIDRPQVGRGGVGMPRPRRTIGRVAEVVCAICTAFARLVAQGKAHVAGPSILTRSGVRHALRNEPATLLANEPPSETARIGTIAAVMDRP
jgi:hypothetical protein